MNLPPLQEEFVLHFGEMGSRWGINRTVGQIYALLFVNEHPLNAEQIAESLGFSRSNVSMGLKELQAWKIVRLKHFPGDRREYFTTPTDLWEIVRTLVEERKRREIDPTLTKLRELQMSRDKLDGDEYANHRIEELTQLIELLTGWYDDINGLETDRLIQLLSLGARVTDLMNKAGNVLPLRRRKGAAAEKDGSTT
ncbi:GbsR/MarR family transcriptional regulator [Acuticoccus sediminis]|uniref:GbsR/MarR family transcriptional regulator n=1 Tax=Acuticoccus sediminis TaxID=2184697 RepID=UPI001CFDA7E1|nr:GbsR/MarR family transcriptional regulator [Acuticoccus sediminis]